MCVIITGGTGLIGKWLTQTLARKGYEIIVLSRDPTRAAHMFGQLGLAHVKSIGWDARTDHGWGEFIRPDSAIVNLAGASPAHWRWTKSYRARMLESRLQAGEAVMKAMEKYGPPDVLVQASAAGYYGDRGQELLTESSSPGQGFRAEVARAWEASIATARTRRCVLRTGLVLDTHAGAFPPLRRFAEALGSRLGDGDQWIPWVHAEDAARAICFLLEHRTLSGPFNVCSPEAVTNREFLCATQRVLHRFGLVPLPATVLRLVLGELSTVVLDSQHLVPQLLVEARFPFQYPRLDQALHHLLLESQPRWRDLSRAV
ncbi:MAG: TIGR01777 family oxidoreductase [Ktedonobacterales bacterium]